MNLNEINDLKWIKFNKNPCLIKINELNDFKSIKQQ